mmetsp:Transcript_4904/g.8976  ORF Transcript_4904/g.8976 Transcript_4904/m.8976 type:complete len:577 (-) Transcript_4904:25-1755(-)
MSNGTTTVASSHTASPLKQLLGAVILMDEDFDEAESVRLLNGLGQRDLKLGFGPDLGGPKLSLSVLERLNDTGVVPVLDDVVRTVVNLDLDGVAAVVDEEDDGLEVVAKHGRHLLDGHLETTVSNEGEKATFGIQLLVRTLVTQDSANGPSDGAITHLELVSASTGKLHLHGVKPRVPDLRDNGRIGSEGLLDVVEEDIDGDGLVILERGRLAEREVHTLEVDEAGVVDLDLGGELLEDVDVVDATVSGAVLDGHVTVVDLDHLLVLEEEGVADSRVVSPNASDGNDQVSTLNHLADARSTDGTPVDAAEVRMVLRNKALGVRKHSDGELTGLSKGKESLLNLGTTETRANKENRLDTIVKDLSDVIDSGIKAELVAKRRLNGEGDGRPHERRVEKIRNVAADLDVNRLAVLNGFADSKIDLAVSILDVADDYLAASNLTESADLLAVIIVQTNSVVENVVGGEIIGVRAATHADDGEILAIGTRNSINDAETSDTESNDNAANSLPAGITISGITSVQFIAAPNHLQLLVLDKLIEEEEVEITRDSEDMVAANLNKSVAKVNTNVSLGHFFRLSG